MVLRQAGTSFQLGQIYDAHQQYDQAIEAYSRAASIASKLQETSPDSEALGKLIGQLQFRAAKSLHLSSRIDESIDAHIAALETVESQRGPLGYTPFQMVQVAETYVELGQLFSKKEEALPEDRDQLFNEALRLLSPLNGKDPEDLSVAILLSRSLAELGSIEREAGQWSSGYRLSKRGLESLNKALGDEPADLDGILELAEARIRHLEFLGNEKKLAREVTAAGVESAELALANLEQSEQMIEPFRSQYHKRLIGIFRSYGDAYKSLGDDEGSNRCYSRVSESLSYLDGSVTKNEG